MNQTKDKYLLDKKFLKFWGNLLLNAAKGQEQLEQLSSFMNMDAVISKDFMNFKGMEDIFREFYDLQSPQSDKKQRPPKEGGTASGDLKMEEAFQNVQQSFEQYATMWGWIPKKTHDDLQQQCDALIKEQGVLKKAYDDLEQKVKSREEIISQLRNLLAKDGKGHMEFFESFQKMAWKQGDEFQNLMNSLHDMFKTENNNTE